MKIFLCLLFPLTALGSITLTQNKGGDEFLAQGGILDLSDDFKSKITLPTNGLPDKLNLENIQVYSGGSQSFTGQVQMVFRNQDGEEFVSAPALLIEDKMKFEFTSATIKDMGFSDFFFVKSGTRESVSLNLIASGDLNPNKSQYNPLENSSIIGAPEGFDLKISIGVSIPQIPECNGLFVVSAAGLAALLAKRRRR